MTIYKKDPKKCVQCGALFMPRRSHTVTCSNVCRLRKFRKTPPEKPPTPGGYLNLGVPPVRNTKKAVIRDAKGKPVQVKLKVKSQRPEWASKAYLGKNRPARKPASKRKTK